MKPQKEDPTPTSQSDPLNTELLVCRWAGAALTGFVLGFYSKQEHVCRVTHPPFMGPFRDAASIRLFTEPCHSGMKLFFHHALFQSARSFMWIYQNVCPPLLYQPVSIKLQQKLHSQFPRKFHLKQVVGASYPARERGCVSRYVKHLEISFKKRILTLDNIESWWEPRRRPVLARGQQLLTSCFLLTSLYFYGDHNSSLIFNSSCWTGSIAGSAQNRLCDNNKTETKSGPRRPEGFLGFV